jgi:hypothetical protein
MPKTEHLKCAPSKIYSDGSCFTVESLKKLAESYNKYITSIPNNKINKIIITDNKKDLVNELTKRITSCGYNQLCWLEQPWVKKTKDFEILKNTFRPKGPQGRFIWLSTTNINEIMLQYHDKYNDFLFLGAVPLDFEDLNQLGIKDLDLDKLINSGINKIGLVINLDEHWKRGSHWVALYADLSKDIIYYFDSYGYKPKKRIADFVKKIAMWCYKRHILKIKKGDINDDEIDTESKFMKASSNKYENILNIKYNKVRHQFKNSECGVYSVNFILRLLNGETFYNICNNITLDDKVNECRKVYFRFN